MYIGYIITICNNIDINTEIILTHNRKPVATYRNYMELLEDGNKIALGFTDFTIYDEFSRVEFEI